MTQLFWQVKIWGLLHDPALKALHTTGRGGNGPWRKLKVMQDWVDQGWDPESKSGKGWQHIHLADYIASASDRGAVGSLCIPINYNDQGLETHHLLSGKPRQLKLSSSAHQKLMQSNRGEFLARLEDTLLPPEIRSETDARKVFWWLWRCLPMATCKAFDNDESLLLVPAETRLPDSSIWDHASITAALAGALTGPNLTQKDLERWNQDSQKELPHLVSFTFTPIQELIKASRKMRDFWAGSWILHYLSARVCWALAWKYGPDSVLYPSLFQQPLIDHWLLNGLPNSDFNGWASDKNNQDAAFKDYIASPQEAQLLTAGFPNVIVMLLPESKVQAAMQQAKAVLKEEWLRLGNLVFKNLHTERHWMPGLTEEHKTWSGWLDSQWQTYWSAVPIGHKPNELTIAALGEDRAQELKDWRDNLYQLYRLPSQKEKGKTDDDARLRALPPFTPEELDFLREAYQHRLEKQGRSFSVNVGSWWPYAFSSTRTALAGVKNARNWTLPTAFGTRSTISGIGPVVHPHADKVSDQTIKQLWQRRAGVFDGSEQLNATEVLKRGLHHVLEELFGLNEDKMTAFYPDLTAGVAGYLRHYQGKEAHLRQFRKVGQEVDCKIQSLGGRLRQSLGQAWGIPWIDAKPQASLRPYHARLLNAGWLLEEIESDEIDQLERQIEQEKDPQIQQRYRQRLSEVRQELRQAIQQVIDSNYPGNSPADWYVLAAGDGDDMNGWLKGNRMKAYEEYMPTDLAKKVAQSQVPDELKSAFDEFRTKVKKRMGPATYNGLSRALLDFSNQLVPYLTEQRYAGRLIYGGGDDVLAYTNLWEWDNWLWDIRQCFKGVKDPEEDRIAAKKGQRALDEPYFKSVGDYWEWQGKTETVTLPQRPLFTLGQDATISFGVVIAHHSVPLAIALEALWKAEEGAKEHSYMNGNPKTAKDAVQVQVLYGNGNKLTATSKFEVFHQWQTLVSLIKNLEPSLFEQAASLWDQHPAPVQGAIPAWVTAFCLRRDFFAGKDRDRETFSEALTAWLETLWQKTQDNPDERKKTIINWLKLAAFILRKRHIQLPGGAQ
jgi:CRISPR-associated protein Cmr2